jgi:hypothetical protein
MTTNRRPSTRARPDQQQIERLLDLIRRTQIRRSRSSVSYRNITPDEWKAVETLLGYYQKPRPKVSPLSFAEISRRTRVSQATVALIAAGCRITHPPKTGSGRKKGQKDEVPRTRKSKYAAAIVAVFKEHPDWDNQRIADEIGSNRETVRLQRKKLGLGPPTENKDKNSS